MATIPEKPTLDGLEATWRERWERDGTYRFDRTATRDRVYSIDTPPPTVSGSLHIGHVFSYTHTDAVARYRRMRGAEVFYPMGWDDNGLPTERRVQNYYGVRCDPTLPYDPDFEAPAEPPTRPVGVDRRNFVALCERLTGEDEVVFEDLWRQLGLSIDWSLTYATIDDRSRATSQRGFLANLARGEAYAAEAPTLWDVDFRTAVAQAELEDREQAAAYHAVTFPSPDGDPAAGVTIETTRPELLPACVALVAHPDDARYRARFGTSVRTPLFDVEVPVVAHPLADPEKGSGIAMICTFGDLTDVIWWRELDLPTRSVVGRDGRLVAEAPDAIASVTGRAAYAEVAGLTVKQAQRRIVELLGAGGQLVGDPRPVTHPVKFYERGERPLEIVTSRQWYIRNGGRDPELRAALLARGAELRWHPAHMQVRYENWVGGLNGDWLISRQRFFGVPIPLWYPVAADGAVGHDTPLVPADASLPVEPSSDCPPGYTEDQRGRPGGFIGDLDVMDTWATSSLSPQIATRWKVDDDLFERVYPMDLRPQGQDIIRTWLFASVVRAHAEFGALPWTDAAISGWVLDPDRKKMSKSKGNVVTPRALLDAHGSDAMRHWACSGRPGTDTAVDEGQMKVGRRLAMKVLNASRFVLGMGEPAAGAVPAAPLDLAVLAGLRDVVAEATVAFEGYDYTRALDRTETFFWAFCDDYLELVKARAYADDPSALATLRLALDTVLRLFAPVLAFVTEEVWSWWRAGSVHRAPWPTVDELPGGGDPAVLAAAAAVLGAVRKAKTAATRSMRAEVASVTVTAPAEMRAAIDAAATDIRAAGRVAQLTLSTGDELAVEVVLAAAEPTATPS